MSNVEETVFNQSSTILESSSRSLQDVSWLGSIQQPETKEPEKPLYLPEWTDSGAAVIHENVVKIQVDGAYHVFPIEKYPVDRKETRHIEERIKKAQNANKVCKKESTEEVAQKSIIFDSSTLEVIDQSSLYDCSTGVENGGLIGTDKRADSLKKASMDENKALKENLFFLWERESSEQIIAQNNITVCTKAVKNKPNKLLVRSSKIADVLTVMSLKYKISFVHLTKETLDTALCSLENSIRRNGSDTGPALRLRKTQKPDDLLETVLRSVSGITVDEISILKKKFGSLAGMSQIGFSVEGVQSHTILQVRNLFSKDS
ncbi:hypothetical protein NEMIN01_0174 [Nematocida minor]|uniref:uncharacterized protein n=1 Tax=Nematocida minor TaxID=1912983 RepID=UPI00221FBDA9|nr:uncharacterized protein NEMIN01_0070 [Nematocida minor]XP_051332076.1 uncharacterized protein NEMIN01_0174 [Nematocida minor]KAI5188806.1 hypothetical protein NEMIN01_0070 [Nematocida minor]KAI5188910.1 hypothetical protein NEMIN01_0174 [Nematocida minor]